MLLSGHLTAACASMVLPAGPVRRGVRVNDSGVPAGQDLLSQSAGVRDKHEYELSGAIADLVLVHESRRVRVRDERPGAAGQDPLPKQSGVSNGDPGWLRQRPSAISLRERAMRARGLSAGRDLLRRPGDVRAELRLSGRWGGVFHHDMEVRPLAGRPHSAESLQPLLFGQPKF